MAQKNSIPSQNNPTLFFPNKYIIRILSSDFENLSDFKVFEVINRLGAVQFSTILFELGLNRAELLKILETGEEMCLCVKDENNFYHPHPFFYDNLLI